MAEIPLESFIQILSAERVEGRGFDMEFVLTADQKAALIDFGSQLAPPDCERQVRQNGPKQARTAGQEEEHRVDQHKK